MGLFGLHLPKKVDQILGGVGRQINPFDHGATFSNPTPPPRLPIVNAPPQPSVFNRAFAQINPLDNGRTWQHPAPITPNGNSIIHQITHNGITNAGGDILKGFTNIAAAPVEMGRGMADQFITHDYGAADRAYTRSLNDARNNILTGIGSSAYHGVRAAAVDPAVEALTPEGSVAHKLAQQQEMQDLNQSPVGQVLDPLQQKLAEYQVHRDQPQLSKEQQNKVIVRNKADVGLDPGASLGKQLLTSAMGAAQLYVPGTAGTVADAARAAKPVIVRQPGNIIDAARDMLNTPRTEGGYIAGPGAMGFRTAGNKGRTFVGVDKKIRYEGSDSSASIHPSYDGEYHAQQGAIPLGEMLHHPFLYRDYPHLKDTPVVLDNTINGTASWDRGVIRLNPNELTTDRSIKSALLHEITHAVQDQEGFARGGSPTEFHLDASVEALKHKKGRGKVIENIVHDMYRRLAGEVEARTVQKRMDLNPDVQAKVPFSKHYDVKPKNQIIKTNGVTVARPRMSVEKSPGDKLPRGISTDQMRESYRNRKMINAAEKINGEPVEVYKWDGRYTVMNKTTGDNTSFATEKGAINHFLKLSKGSRERERRFPERSEAGFIKIGRDAKTPDKPVTGAKPPKVEPVKVGLKTEIKRALSDQDQVILDQLKAIDKANPVPKGKPTRVQQFMYNSNMQRGSKAIANQRLTTSENIDSAFGGMSKRDSKAFSDYANARTELASAKLKGKSTKGKVSVSQPIEVLKNKFEVGHARFGDRFDALNAHYKELAGVWHDAGILDDKTFKRYTKNNDYIRLQRDMGDLVPNMHGAGRGNSYQLGSTTAKQRRRGSSRATLDAGLVTAERTQQVYHEAAKNKTGTQLVDTLQQHGLAEKLSAKKAQNENTVSIFRNGKKEFYRVPPEMKIAMDNINPYHMNAVMQILAAPGRLLRAGVTGLNPVFIARNLVKDQFGSAINSEHMLATHNPRTFFNGLWRAGKGAAGVEHNAIWQDFLKHYGDQTSYDLTRNVKDTKAVMNRIRGGRKAGTVNVVKHPVRALENIASITEKSTRFQNYVGEYRRAIKKGATPEEASQKAAMAAWQNSVDFSRAGTWGRTINTVIPYWNPATQGVRQMGRTLHAHPVKSVFAGTALIGVPLATATAWNLSSPDTKSIYDNIPEYEKDNNLILVPPGTKQNQDGTYDVIKIPLPPGYKDVFMPIRRALEAFHNKKPLDAAKIGQDILSAVGGPVQAQNAAQFGGSFIPQAVKPFIQQEANKDLFTGQKIVPDYMQQATDAQGNPVPESKKAYKTSSGTAIAIGNKFGVSPIRVEKFIKDTGGTVGLNLENLADNLLTPKQVGGQSPLKGFKRSFASAQGITNTNASPGAKHFDQVKEVTKGFTQNEQAAFNALHPAAKNFLGDKIYERDATYDPAARLDIYNRFPKVFEADKKLDAKDSIHNPLYQLENWQVKKVLEKENLVPGATDPELSKLYTQEWYQNYRQGRTNFFNQLADQAKKAGKPFGAKDNPYPETPPDLQKIMDGYDALPKGTGARSSWIKSNPGAWAAMQHQFALVDNWQNIARGKRGLDMTEGALGQQAGYRSGSGSGYSRRGGGGGRGSTKVYTGNETIKKYSVGGNITKGSAGIVAGKVSVKAKPRKSSSGKITVRSSKLKVA